MHLRKLQAVLGLGGPCQSSSQGRRADCADGVVHLQSGGRLVSPDGSSIATFSLPTLVPEEGRAIVCRHVDDPEAGQLRGKNATTASKTVWPENLDRPAHRASQPNRVSDTSAQDPASSTSSRSIRRGEFHPPGRSRTPSKSAKLELRTTSTTNTTCWRPSGPTSSTMSSTSSCWIACSLRMTSAPGPRPRGYFATGAPGYPTPWSGSRSWQPIPILAFASRASKLQPSSRCPRRWKFP